MPQVWWRKFQEMCKCADCGRTWHESNLGEAENNGPLVNLGDEAEQEHICKCGGENFKSIDYGDEGVKVCRDCGRELHEAKKKGPSKDAAKSWVKGTKKFSDKVAKAKKAGMKNPEGFAAWMQHKATGKWPSSEK